MVFVPTKVRKITENNKPGGRGAESEVSSLNARLRDGSTIVGRLVFVERPAPGERE